MDPEAKQALKAIARALTIMAMATSERPGSCGVEQNQRLQNIIELGKALAILDEMEKKA